MNLALLRKDLHLFRLPLAASLLLVVVPYLFAASEVTEAWHEFRTLDRTILVLARDAAGTWRPARVPIKQFAGVLATHRLLDAALAGLGLAAVSAAAYGGIAFAAERRDGSAEFLAMLPVSRLRIAATKFAAAGACLLLPALVHGGVIAAWSWTAWPVNAASPGPGVYAWMRDDLWNCLAVVLLLFGVAWLASAFLAKPAVAAVLALEVGVVAVYFVLRLVWQVHEHRSEAVMMGPVDAIVTFLPLRAGYSADALGTAAVEAARLTAAAVGVFAFLAGTAAYIRRVRP